MTDPCKESKCLKYPICIQQTEIHQHYICKSLQQFLNIYLISISNSTRDIPINFTPSEVYKIYQHLHHIFPKLKQISFILAGKHIEIFCDKLIYKVIGKRKDPVKYYSFEPIINNTKRDPYLGSSNVTYY